MILAELPGGRRLLSLALAVLVTGCQEPRVPVEISGATMGTRYHVTIAQAAPGLDTAALHRDIEAELERLNAQMSTYRPDSEISAFNAQTAADWFAVSAEFAQVVRRARDVSALTQGAFDVTVAPLVNRWSFGPTGPPDGGIPSHVEIEQLRQAVGFDLIEARRQPPAIRKRRPDVQLDLSAIAKGFAVDRLAELLAARGVANFMVEIGGEIRVRGSSPRAAAWKIGIEKPQAGQRTVQRVVLLRDAALATSGDYRNFIEIDGRRYAHVIDPRSGRPVTHRLASVSVVAADCLTADAWATALMVLGPVEGYNSATREGIAALFIERTPSGLVERTTGEFAQLLATAQENSP